MNISPKKYHAIIFDLFGTLVGNYSTRQREQVLSIMASLLHLPPDRFTWLWNKDTWQQRATGTFASLEENILFICQMLETPVETDQVLAATRLWIDYKKQGLKPLPDALVVLSTLKKAGYLIGMISDCSYEIPGHWRRTPFASLIDCPIFSCLVGTKKPDPRIYALACEGLAIQPSACLYVGDGSSHELTGAARFGMHPVWVREETLLHNPDAYQPDAERWRGPTINTLKELLPYLNTSNEIP
jgi:putative hydrolase of the HAD superfamily